MSAVLDLESIWVWHLKRNAETKKTHIHAYTHTCYTHGTHTRIRTHSTLRTGKLEESLVVSDAAQKPASSVNCVFYLVRQGARNTDLTSYGEYVWV